MNSRILVVDDEEEVRDFLHDVLEDEGYEVVEAANGQDGLKAFFDCKPALVLSDITMPLMDGWQLLSRIREVSETPVILLTGLGKEPHAVRGLRGGADDYIVKPPRAAEFCARIAAAIRRGNPSEAVEEGYLDSALHLDFLRHKVEVHGRPVHLSALEFRLLAALVQRKGIVLSVDRLLDICWEGGIGGPENVRVYIGYLRKKIKDDPKAPRLIETVKEFGYRYCPQLA